MNDTVIQGLKALLVAAILSLSLLSIAGIGAVVGHKQAEATTASGNIFDAFTKEQPQPYTIVRDIDGTVNIYIVSGIVDADKYLEVMEILRNATSQDTVVFHLTSPGGQLDTMLMLASGMARSSAHVVADVQGGAYSAAAYISLAADEIRMEPGSVLMFHDVQIGIQAERSKIMDALGAMETQLREFIARYNTQGVLTQEEIDGLFNGQDLYLTKEEVDARIKATKEKKEGAVAQGDDTGSSDVSHSGIFVGNTGSDYIFPAVRNAH